MKIFNDTIMPKLRDMWASITKMSSDVGNRVKKMYSADVSDPKQLKVDTHAKVAPKQPAPEKPAVAEKVAEPAPALQEEKPAPAASKSSSTSSSNSGKKSTATKTAKRSKRKAK